MTDEILQRYCHEMILDNKQQGKLTKPSYRERCQSTPPHIQRDIVVASPRLLPFPYHNDSMFLPTAETTQYNHLHSSASSSLLTSSRADSSSLLPDSEFLASRPQSTTNTILNNSSSAQSLNYSTRNDNSKPSIFERRSLPIKLDYSNIVISKSGSKQQRFLRRSSSFGSSSTTLSAPTANEKKRPWLKRILKFFNKNNKHNNKKHNNDNNNINEEDIVVDQVWYCQYNKNPSTNFENYYHHQYQHQRSIVFAS